jgi:hypothetical protein
VLVGIVKFGGAMDRFLLSFCVVAFGIGLGFGQERADATVGRYHTAQVNQRHLTLIDTTTGECWVEDNGRRWIDLKFPTKETKVTDGKVGRFRLEVLRSEEAELPSLVVCDTADGRCWRADYLPESMTWQALGSPRGK